MSPSNEPESCVETANSVSVPLIEVSPSPRTINSPSELVISISLSNSSPERTRSSPMKLAKTFPLKSNRLSSFSTEKLKVELPVASVLSAANRRFMNDMELLSVRKSGKQILYPFIQRITPNCGNTLVFLYHITARHSLSSDVSAATVSLYDSGKLWGKLEQSFLDDYFANTKVFTNG